jgi:hypothetical protein
MVAKKKRLKPSKTATAASKPPKLTDTQLIILSEGSQQPDRRIVIPPRLKGNAIKMAFNALLRRGLVEPVDIGHDEPDQPDGKSDGIIDSRHFRISDDGLRAIGLAPEGEAEADKVPVAEPTGLKLKKLHKTKTQREKPSRQRRKTRQVSASRKKPIGKQQNLIALLRRANGASLNELTKASGWQAHSVRGFLSGTINSKLGMKLERTRDGRRGSVYRISK